MKLNNRVNDPSLTSPAFLDLENSLFAALETYSNVHRGSGHFSVVTTHLFEQARNIVLDYLNLSKNKYSVIFCTPSRSEQIIKLIEPGSFHCLSSKDIGLSIGVRALAVIKKSLPGGAPFQTGGGTARLVSPDYVIWAQTPDKFEAGTPAIINIILFALVLKSFKQYGNDIFKLFDLNNLSAKDILYCSEFENLSGAELLSALRHKVIGAGKLVPTKNGVKPFIFLDNAASTPTFTPVLSAFKKTLRLTPQNQKNIIEEVKLICSGYLAAPLSSYDILFTSNTTEAINIAAENLKLEINSDCQPVVLNTLLEHNSNELPWRAIPGCSLLKLSLNDEGFVDIHELEILLDSYNLKNLHGTKRIKLVAVTAVSNVLGVFNDLENISRIVHRYNARLLVDAAQLVAHRKINIEEVDIDYFGFSAHKAYAPFGSGALVIKKGLLNLNPEAIELLRSSGEENAAGIAALGKAFILLQQIGLDLIRHEEQTLTLRLLKGLIQIPGIRLFCKQYDLTTGLKNKGGVISFEINGMNPHKVAKLLAEIGGIGVRSGCHCSHILIKHLLKIPLWVQKIQRIFVILFPRIELPGMVRISLGIENTEDDIDTCLNVMKEISWGKKERTRYPFENVKDRIEDFIKIVEHNVYS
jgi:selenocysteine lyase/cysteine desulfurase